MKSLTKNKWFNKISKRITLKPTTIQTQQFNNSIGNLNIHSRRSVVNNKNNCNSCYYLVKNNFATQFNNSTKNYSTTPTGNNNISNQKQNSIPTTSESPYAKLNPMEYDLWSKEEVCALLCTDQKNGGAGLTVRNVELLYKASFNGKSLACIVVSLQKGTDYAYQKLKSKYQNSGHALTVDLLDTLDIIVNWVDDLYKTRLYHLWEVEKIREQLSKPVNEGGVGLTKFEIDNLKIEKDSIVGANMECNKKITDYLERFIITIPHGILLNDSIVFELSEKLLNEINNFSEKDLTRKMVYECVEEFYERARLIMTGWKNIELPSNLTQKLLEKIEIESSGIGKTR